MSFNIGDKVFISPFRQAGEVTAIKGDLIQVHIGSLSVWKNISEVTLQPSQKTESTFVRSKTKKRPGRDSRMISVDLHGQTQEEAKRIVAEKVSEGFLYGAEYLDIVHGLGTWALKNAITELLPQLGVGIEIRELPSNPGVMRVYFRR